MRNLLYLIVGALACSPAYANWMSESDFEKASSGASGTTVYMDKSKCEKKSAERCFDIVGKNLSYQKIKKVMIPDTDSPKYLNVSNVTACGNDKDLCGKQMASLPKDYCPEGSELGLRMNKLMPGFSFLCGTLNGEFEKKEVAYFVDDESLKAAASARVEAAANKESKRKEALSRLRSLKPDELTSDDVLQAVKDLVSLKQ